MDEPVLLMNFDWGILELIETEFEPMIQATLLNGDVEVLTSEDVAAFLGF